MSHPTRVAILGAGPAGLGAAYKLAQKGGYEVYLFERQSVVGGNAGSFDLGKVRVDFGSHRLHPSCDAEILQDIRHLVGADLLERPRHGRIRLKSRWIHFPLKLLDLALRLPPAFALGVITDTLRTPLKNSSPAPDESFASVLRAGLGQTICNEFYFPYARKIWGVEPEAVSSIQAHRRVAAKSLRKMIGKVIGALSGGESGARRRSTFYYPKKGYGQISEAYAEAAKAAGASLRLNANIESLEQTTNDSFTVTYRENERLRTQAADYVWSTIPITNLVRALKFPAPSSELLESAARIQFRSMILIYLHLPVGQFTEYDAHYFPMSDIKITRLSEPKNYSGTKLPETGTVLCAELPCQFSDSHWQMSDQDLGELVAESLERAEIPLPVQPDNVITRRLRFAYPIYLRGFDEHFQKLDRCVEQFDRLLTFGRQGLFAHDNTHHALHMAYSAVKCLTEDGDFDRDRWGKFRKVFETHVVED